MRFRLPGFRTGRGLRLGTGARCYCQGHWSARDSIGVEGLKLPIFDAKGVGLACLPQPPKWNSDLVGVGPPAGGLEVGVGGRDEIIQLREFGSAADGEFVWIASLAAIEAGALSIRFVSERKQNGPGEREDQE